MKKLLLILFCVVLTACSSIPDAQKGGSGQIVGKVGSVNVVQPENAKDEATVAYNEDSITIPYKPNDKLNIKVETQPDGKVTRDINFEPVNQGEVVVSTINSDVKTGTSFEDTARELGVFLESSKTIMYAGIAFIAAGAAIAFLLKATTAGAVVAGIGGLLMLMYTILPQLYANWAWVALAGFVVLPLLWYLHHKKLDRITKASLIEYEEFKKEYPEIAKKRSSKFKEILHPKDVDYMKHIKSKRDKL